MDFELSNQDKKIRDEVRSFLKSELDEEVIREAESGLGPGSHTRRFLRNLGNRGWLLPMLPSQLGGINGTHLQKYIIWDQLLYHRALDVGVETNFSNVATPLMMFGNEEQKQKYLLPLARAEILFATGYTEPQAGSDLGVMEMKAVEKGDHYVITGQKVFNTACHYADCHWLAAVTDPSGNRYKNISLFVVDMHAPGITIRPLWLLDGERQNEVFYDAVRVPKANLVGLKNRGFYQMLTALTFERNYIVGAIRRDFEDLVSYVKETEIGGRTLRKDPLIRKTLAELRIQLEAAYLMGCQCAWMVDNGRAPVVEAPMVKLFSTELTQRLAYSGISVMGLYGQLRANSRWAPLKGRFESLYRLGVRRTIGGGTSEIIRNTLATRGLGLPS